MKDDGSLIIKSTRNPRVRSILALQKRRERESAGTILIEGVREVERALAGGIVPVEAFVCTGLEARGRLGRLVKGLADAGAEIVEVDEMVYSKIAYRGSTEGVVATARRPDLSLRSLEPGLGVSAETPPLLLVTDGIEKPGNLGAMMRTADGAGVSGLIVSGTGADIFSPNVIRASIGTVFNLRSAEADPAEAARYLSEKAIAIVTSTPSADLLYHEADFTGPVAIVVGSEDRGACSAWMDAASVKVRIPMNGTADSLNVSVSASILLYEAVRQRAGRGEAR